jgi:hypothetical protein
MGINVAQVGGLYALVGMLIGLVQLIAHKAVAYQMWVWF